MFVTILITVSVTLWCLVSFVLYGYHYLLEVILDLPIVGDSPRSAHSALKSIIQKIIREANELPKLQNENPHIAAGQENRTYEDLLSTAILNKIINTSQNSNNLRADRSSRANSVCSGRSTSSKRRKLQKEFFLGEETLNNKWKNLDTDTASISSLEEWVHSDSSLGSTKYVDRLSFTIKQRIEEVSSSESDRDADFEENEDANYFRSHSAFDNDEPNWFLQRRTFLGGTSSPVPVPMLVPDPSTEAKVLIGDKELDDTSDLSDVPSDIEEPIDKAGLIDVKNHLIESKTLIGGKNLLADLNSANLSDDEVSADSGVKECKDFDEVDSEGFSTSKLDHEISADVSISSDGSNTEKDTEYTERYATLPRTILVSPQNNRSQETRNNSSNEQRDSIETDNFEEENEEIPTEFITGAYSKREKEKWKHAVELKNNPYSKENIEKRIKSRNTINSLFGSDYYIRQACLPSGAKRTEVGVENTPTIELTNVQPEDSTTNHYIEEAQDDMNQDSIVEENCFMAQPVYVNDTTKSLEDNSKPNSLDISLENFNPEILSPEITSDSDISFVNFYDVTESIVYKKLTTDNDEEIQTAEKFFDFESLDASSISEQRKEESEKLKPVARPRKRLSAENSNDTKMFAVDPDPESVRLLKYNKDINENNPDSVPYIINRRSDNTLIKKIYSDPGVRSFALNNRNKLPISIEKTTQNKPVSGNIEVRLSRVSSRNLEDIADDIQIITDRKFMNPPAENNTVPNVVMTHPELNDNERDDLEDIDCFYARAFAHMSKINKNNTDHEEINRLKEQKLVANRLKEFSKSTTNLAQNIDENFDGTFVPGIVKSTIKTISNSDNEEPIRKFSNLKQDQRSNSVKDLRKKFEQIDVNSKNEKPILYSLTGRSISKQFKEKLRELNEDTPSLSQLHSIPLSHLEVEENSR